MITAGVALRVLALLSSGPIYMFLNDSREYLRNARQLSVNGYHPLGYPVFLRLAFLTGHPLAISVVQHGLGVACGILIAATALRVGAPGWLAALAAVPQLLDPYVVVLEQMVMAETLMTLLVTAAAAMLMTVGRERLPAPAVAALLLGVAVLFRTAAVGALLAALVWLAVRRPPWPIAAGTVAAAALPLAGYAALFTASTGHVGLTAHSSRFLYARMAPFADCGDVRLTGNSAHLCDPRPVKRRPQPDYYLWHPDSPLKHLPEQDRDAAAGGAGHAMLDAQPLTWMKATLVTTGQFLSWGPWAHHVGVKQADPSILLADSRLSTARPLSDPRASSGVRTVGWVRRGPMSVLHDYQRWVTTPLPVLVAVTVAGLLRPFDARRRVQVAVPAAAAIGLLVMPAALSGWDVRYLLPTLPLFSLAAAATLAPPPQGQLAGQVR